MTPTESDALLEGRFQGIEAFRERVRAALAHAAQAGWRELILSDPDFHDWPLGERAVAESLQQWATAGPGRKLVMLAGHYDDVIRNHARFVTWRKTWAHLIECRRCTAADAAALPSALWTPSWALHRLELTHSAGVCTTLPAQRLALHEALQEALRQSSPAFPATTMRL